MAGEQALFLFFMRQMLLFFFSRMYLRRGHCVEEGLDVAGSGTMRSNGQQFLQSLQSFKLKAGSIGQCGNVTVRAIAHFCHGAGRRMEFAYDPDLLQQGSACERRSYDQSRLHEAGRHPDSRWAIVHDRTPAFDGGVRKLRTIGGDLGKLLTCTRFGVGTHTVPAWLFHKCLGLSVTRQPDISPTPPANGEGTWFLCAKRAFADITELPPRWKMTLFTFQHRHRVAEAARLD
ncbi:hypothetical protein Bbelb_446860 [Branchiostoma belcheri]|nr:hypothetical protein Bbelb_446860 [Branchiostoma belcheri]